MLYGKLVNYKRLEPVPKLIYCALTRTVLEQALGKTGQIGLKSDPVFPLNLRKLFQKLKFWNSLTGQLFYGIGFFYNK
jgi:hypothetical protein